MTTGEKMGLIVAAVSVTALCIAMIHYRINEEAFKIWLVKFERELGHKVAEEDVDLILRDMFTEDIPMDQAVGVYLELKYIQNEKDQHNL